VKRNRVEAIHKERYGQWFKSEDEVVYE